MASLGSLLDEVPDLQACKDERLVSDAGDADSLDDKSKTIRDNAVSTPLTEYTERHRDEESPSISLGLEHVCVGDTGMGLLLRLDGVGDPLGLTVDKG
ncbi:Ff.00g020560.m01.CDS01 [Fusarium sp. VM40]|nr:Ff.00g020560.m01.CDS01 [Fusarium sp. VM40]